jgi:hypothetical protein
MPMTPSSAAARRPTVDEWGVYDPQQAGLAALFARLTMPSGPRPEPAEADSAHPGDASIKPTKG